MFVNDDTKIIIALSSNTSMQMQIEKTTVASRLKDIFVSGYVE